MALRLKLNEPVLDLDFAGLSPGCAGTSAELACAGRQGSRNDARNGGAECRFRECNILPILLHSGRHTMCTGLERAKFRPVRLYVRAAAHMRLKPPISSKIGPEYDTGGLQVPLEEQSGRVNHVRMHPGAMKAASTPWGEPVSGSKCIFRSISTNCSS